MAAALETARFSNAVWSSFRTDEDYRKFLLERTENVTYIVFQKEMCPETGREHFQGYVEFKKRVTVKSVRAEWRVDKEAFWIQPRRGTLSEARDYAMKAETRIEGPWESGEMKKPGKRSDLEEVAELVKGGARAETIATHEDSKIVATFIKYNKGIERTIDLQKHAIREWKTEVIYVWGEPGVGKTRLAVEAGAKLISYDGKFFGGYRGDPIVCIDDFDPAVFDRMGRQLMLKLMDRYEEWVNVKNGNLSWCPRTLYITSNYPPEAIFGDGITGKIPKEFARRLDKVIHLKEGGDGE